MRTHQPMNAYILGTAAATALALTQDSRLICFADDGMMSLADLAGLDVSDIEEVRYEVLPAGVYDFEVVEATLNEGTNKDGDKRFTAEFTFKVLECKSVISAGVDRESLKDRKHTEKQYLNPAETQQKIAEAIGRIRAFVTDMGLDSSGSLGPMVEACKGHVFTSKITNAPDNQDKSIIRARLRLDSKKK